MAIGEYVKKNFKPLIPQILQNHPTCFYQAVLVALSGAAEQLWEEVGFKCPSFLKEVSYHHYALVNFFGPAISLWMICLLASNMAKRLCQGQRGHCSDGKWWSTFGSVFFRTLVIPLAWIFVSFMDGDIVACYSHLPNCTMDSNTIFVDGINCTTNITRWNEANKTESKLYGWYFAGGSLFLGFVGVICYRCRSERPYFPNFYSNILKKRERIEMEKFLEEGAKETSKENAGAIKMAVNDIKSKDWKAICMLHQTKTVKPSADAKKEYYSPLSEWVGNNPAHLEKYKASIAEKKEEKVTPNPNPAPSPEAPQVTPNHNPAPSPEAPLQGSASSSPNDQESAQAQNL